MANEIAKAYVQIVPTAKGIKAMIEKEMGGEVAAAGKSGGASFMSGFSGALGGIGKVVAGALAAGGALIGKTVKDAVSEYADFEQLTGGIETLFKDSADQVMEYAQNAYKTAGLSANEYMETVTGFSASLLQATGRGTQQNIEELKEALDKQYTETKRQLEDRYAAARELGIYSSSELREIKRNNEDQLNALKAANKEQIAEAERLNNVSVSTEESIARAAELADQAVQDMADNANKMGSSMESIQNAYQGFAKQNYTMLDNLKLGYGGTKEEMQRLLEDATALSGVEYDISSLSDVYEAIHVIQTELGITGTTAKEASETISGSLAAMKAAWQNVLTGLGDQDADINELIARLAETATTAIRNVLPRISQALEGIGTLIAELAPVVAEAVPKLVAESLPSFVGAAVSFVSALVQTLSNVESVNALIDAAVEIVLTLTDALIANIDAVIGATVNIITAIIKKLTEPETLEKLVSAAIQLVAALIVGLAKAIPDLLDAVWVLNMNVLDAIGDAGDALFEAGRGVVQHIADGISEAVANAYMWGRDLIDNFLEGIKARVQRVIDAVKDLAADIKSYLGFSEPELGPLSDFHTYAPDMVELFAQGIRDSAHLVTDEIGAAFQVQPVVDFAAQTRRLAMPEAQGAEPALAAADAQTPIALYASINLDGQRLWDGLLPYKRMSESLAGVGVIHGY